MTQTSTVNYLHIGALRRCVVVHYRANAGRWYSVETLYSAHDVADPHENNWSFAPLESQQFLEYHRGEVARVELR